MFVFLNKYSSVGPKISLNFCFLFVCPHCSTTTVWRHGYPLYRPLYIISYLPSSFKYVLIDIQFLPLVSIMWFSSKEVWNLGYKGLSNSILSLRATIPFPLFEVTVFSDKLIRIGEVPLPGMTSSSQNLSLLMFLLFSAIDNVKVTLTWYTELNLSRSLNQLHIQTGINIQEVRKQWSEHDVQKFRI